jgi:hypothetical protein
MSESNRPAAYGDRLVQGHRCPLGCNAAVISRPGGNVEIWSHGEAVLILRTRPYNGKLWLLPALHRALAHATQEAEMLATSFVSSIRGCARCDGDGHEDVTWLPLTHPIEDSDGVWTHWAPCPTNGQPILMQRTERAEVSDAG